MAYDANLTLLSSTALTATGQGSGVSLRKPSLTTGTNRGGTPRRGLVARVVCTAASGTTPTAAFSIQHSDDNSTWTTIASDGGGNLTSTGVRHIPFNTDKPWVRLAYTIGGTSPSFTCFADIGDARP